MLLVPRMSIYVMKYQELSAVFSFFSSEESPSFLLSRIYFISFTISLI